MMLVKKVLVFDVQSDIENDFNCSLRHTISIWLPFKVTNDKERKKKQPAD